MTPNPHQMSVLNRAERMRTGLLQPAPQELASGRRKMRAVVGIYLRKVNISELFDTGAARGKSVRRFHNADRDTKT